MSYSHKCLLNISDSVPEFGANMAQVTLGKFFSEAPQIRESYGDSKKIYEHKRKRGFIDSWSKNFDGLQDSSDGMICTYCKKFPNIAGPSSFISGNKSYKIDGIRSHCSSPKHLQCSEAYFGGIMDIAIRKLSEKNRTLMIYMFNTAYCIMKEELPYTLLFYSMNVYSMNGHC